MASDDLERYRQIVETATDAFWIFDTTNGRLAYVSPGYERIWGRTCESLYASPEAFFDAIHPDDRARVVADLDWSQRGLPIDLEYRIVQPDGAVRWVWDRGFPVRDASGTLESYIGIAQDVTERKLAAAEARLFAERFELISRATHDGIWDWDMLTNTAWWSPTYYDTFGIDRSEKPTYMGWVSRVHPEDRERVVASFERAIAERRETWSDEHRILHGSGRVLDVFDRAYLLVDERGTPVRMIGATMDISARRELERQVRHAQKMEAVGQLAGGVAHDFNNILQAILIQAELAKKTSLPPQIVELVTGIQECTHRAAALTRQLRLFGRRELVQPRDLDLNDIVRDVATILERAVGTDIEMVLELASTPVLTHADPGMIDQVLMNLALNARDAMPNGGRLVIATRVVHRVEDRLASIAVTDTGTGMSADVIPRIFEPFFTTKQPGDGSGLGLATAFGIVEQHRGSIEVESELGHGSTFRVFLPAIERRAEPPCLVTAAVAASGSGRILLVEDDTLLRRLTRRILEEGGYDVVEAVNGVDALARCDASAAIDLVLTDIVMPGGIDGRELATRLRARRPDLKVVFTSGHSRELTKPDGGTLLQKPVTPERLLEAVRLSLAR